MIASLVASFVIGYVAGAMVTTAMTVRAFRARE